MELISILLIAVSVLTALSGFAIFAGASRGERANSGCFFLATLGAAIWAVSVAIFMTLPADAAEAAPLVIFALYSGAVVMEMGLVPYIGWKYKIGKVMTFLTIAGGLALIGLLFYDLQNPSLLYSSITLSASGNAAHLSLDWYYWLYLGFFVMAAGTELIILLYDLLHTRVRSAQKGKVVFMVGMSITAVLALIFDILLPMQRYDLIWVGPLAISTTIISFYYAILRFRVMTLTTGWLKILSYVIIMVSGAIIYMIAFFAIFTALFRIPSPSPSVLLLNFIMVVVMLLLIPVINEISAFVRSLISVQTMDIAYITKRLNGITPQDLNLRDLATFLSDHMHFEYVGFLIDGRLYGSGSLPLSANELKQIDNLKAAKAGSVWQEFNESVEKICAKQEITAIAELHDAKGKAFGQIILGKPLGKTKFDRRDLIQTEMVINLVAAVIDSGKHLGA